MLKSKRIDRKKRKKRILSWLLFIGLSFLFAGIGIFFYLLQPGKSLYISPLSQNFSFNQTSKGKDISYIKNHLKKINIDIQSVTDSNGYYLIVLTNKSTVIISPKKNIDSQLSSLQFIVTRLTMEGKLFTQLDLRFDKPVIKLKSI